jgi:hypothetical protein
MLMPALAILEGRNQDPLVEVRHHAWRPQRPEESEDAGAPTDLGGAGGTALDVGGQSSRVCRLELVEQERVDQVARSRTVQGMVAERVRHIPYMT